jgi:hypothetical protein
MYRKGVAALYAAALFFLYVNGKMVQTATDLYGLRTITDNHGGVAIKQASIPDETAAGG